MVSSLDTSNRPGEPRSGLRGQPRVLAWSPDGAFPVISSCDLSILCVTRSEECVIPLLISMAESAADLGCELVIAADGAITANELERVSELRNNTCHIAIVESSGYIESVLDDALSYTTGDYILRLDDDEQISQGTYDWLVTGGYRSSPHWKFPRAHIWSVNATYSLSETVTKREEHGVTIYERLCQEETPAISCIINPPLWPDHQTRLSHRTLSGGRTILHCGSPFGGGEVAPCLIEHHKFVIKTLTQRREIVERYNRIQAGMGDGFRVFSTPEDVISPSDIQLMSLSDLEKSLL